MTSGQEQEKTNPLTTCACMLLQSFKLYMHVCPDSYLSNFIIKYRWILCQFRRDSLTVCLRNHIYSNGTGKHDASSHELPVQRHKNKKRKTLT